MILGLLFYGGKRKWLAAGVEFTFRLHETTAQ
jgi:hypothetical protein